MTRSFPSLLVDSDSTARPLLLLVTRSNDRACILTDTTTAMPSAVEHLAAPSLPPDRIGSDRGYDRSHHVQ